MSRERKLYGAAAAAVARKRQRQLGSMKAISGERSAAVEPFAQAQPEDDLIKRELEKLTPATPPELPEDGCSADYRHCDQLAGSNKVWLRNANSCQVQSVTCMV